MNKTEFLKMALEKLTAASNYIDTLGGVSKGYRMDIERLKAALANEALERKAENARELGLDYEPLEAKDEPVAWKWHQAPTKTQWGYEMVVADIAIDKDHTASIYCEHDQTAKVEVMFSTPPQRTWVRLTEEEISDCMEMSIQKTCRAIEAKLKEKNT